jgi:phosphoribosylanthranilate isomerase
VKTAVKICGVTTPEAVEAAARFGAQMIGFVFYPKSPRALALPIAAQLAAQVPTGLRSVGLFVDPSDEELEAVTARVPLALVQLHGNESPARVAAVKARFALPVIKALAVSSAADVAAAEPYANVADYFLFDAKPPTNVSALPGGNGLAFDWRLLQGAKIARPWLLAGGLTPENVVEAAETSGAKMVDVSSGVESRPGVKDVNLIESFMRAARTIH